MNTTKMLSAACLLFILSFTASAQVSKDSIQILKQQKESLTLSSKINTQKMQLAKLENNIEKKTKEMEESAVDAQQAATKNAEAASSLNGNPQDKSLARKAENAGDEARKSAKRARVAADNLSDLRKDIESLKNKISEGETKLAANPVLIPAQQ